MKRKTIWKISVVTTLEAEEAVTELLAAHVAPSPSAYTDAETGETTVSVYSPTKPTNISGTRIFLRRKLADLKSCGLNIGAARVSIRELPEENWALSWKRHFQPLDIAGALLIKPSWSKRKPRKSQSVIVLDPGLSFGTGQHPTTEFCLHQLVARRNPELRQSFLDMGTGSGILAIAAAKLGYAPVHAFDFDPQAVAIARRNARRNRVEKKLRITQANLSKMPPCATQKFDVICANLISTLLISERERILSRLKSPGILVLAGILKTEFSDVAACYEAAGLRPIASKAQNEWRSGAFAL